MFFRRGYNESVTRNKKVAGFFIGGYRVGYKDIEKDIRHITGRFHNKSFVENILDSTYSDNARDFNKELVHKDELKQTLINGDFHDKKELRFIFLEFVKSLIKFDVYRYCLMNGYEIKFIEWSAKFDSYFSDKKKVNILKESIEISELKNESN